MRDGSRLILVRHGRVAANWQGRIYGDLDVPLAPEGEEQSRLVAETLRRVPLRAVVSSGLSRTEFAAHLIRAAHRARGEELPRRDEPRLREIHRGAWAGMGEAEVEAERPGGWAAWWAAEGRVPPPGGETLEQLSARVLPALHELADEFAGGTVAIVAHCWVLRVAACEALALPLERATSLDVPHGCLADFAWPARAARAAGAAPRLAALGADHVPH